MRRLFRYFIASASAARLARIAHIRPAHVTAPISPQHQVADAPSWGWHWARSRVSGSRICIGMHVMLRTGLASQDVHVMIA